MVMLAMASVAHLCLLVKSGSLLKETCFKSILSSSDFPLNLCGVIVEERNVVRFFGQKVIFASR